MSDESHVTWESIHCHADNVSRKQGHSAVAAAAYNTRSKLVDQRTGKPHRYTRKKSDIVFSAILAHDGAPDWITNRNTFWNRVEAAENRRDARVAKTIEAALPREVPQELWQSLIDEFVAPFVVKGLVVDYAIHDGGTGHNPHCHILLPTRPLDGDGFASSKLTKLNSKRFLYDIREAWANVCNKFLKKSGSGTRLDHRSLKARGLARLLPKATISLTTLPYFFWTTSNSTHADETDICCSAEISDAVIQSSHSRDLGGRPSSRGQFGRIAAISRRLRHFFKKNASRPMKREVLMQFPSWEVRHLVSL